MIITAIVVVLIPPAVEPGLPPINIRTIVSILLASVKAPVSTELNPAVLAVTELNNAPSILSLTFIVAKRLLFSKIRNDKKYHPSKETVILLGLSLELNEQEIDILLNSASYSLPKNNRYDLIIRFCFIFG